MARILSNRSLTTCLQSELRARRRKQRRAMLFESLENRSLLATITGNTAIGGFEALNSASLLYQLNASSLPLANGSPVTAWNNSGTAANNFAQGDPLKQPTFQNTGLGVNNLPGVVFDGSTAGQTGNPIVAPNADELLLSTSTSPATVFIVNSTATNNSSLDGIWGLENGDYGIRRTGANNWQNPGGGFNSSLFVNGATGTNPSAPLNNDHILSALRPPGTAIATTSIGDYFQVGTNAARSWGGQIGDVLAFSRTLNSTERMVIENSLSAKYGIALAGGDIYAGDNNALGDYDRGVVGIGGQLLNNVAFGKLATQSALGHPQGDAEHAVDGNTNGNYGANSATHTPSQTDPFWQVDLGGTFTIYTLDLWNRTDCCGERLRDIRIEILNAANAVVWQTPTLINPGNVLGSPPRITVDVAALAGGAVAGNKVRITSVGAGQIVTLAEVQVWATNVQANVAVGDPSTQSSTGFGGVASRGNDGNTDGNYGGNSVTHTNTETNPFWQVDLGVDTPVSTVLLYNRTDCCGNRLSDVRVEVLDAALVPVFTINGLNPGNGLETPPIIGANFQALNGGVPVTGRFVRVTRIGSTEPLSLAEVEVLTPPTASPPEVSSAGANGFGIEQTGSPSTTSYLTAGYKQVTNSLVTTDLPMGVDSRWDRAWYVDKTGSMSATMAFDFSDAGIASVPASTLGYRLLYSPNNNFESANSSFTALNLTPTVVGDLITFNVPDGTLLDGYYTLGLLDSAVTLQPDSGAANNGTADFWRIVRGGPGNADLEFYHGASLVSSSPFASLTSVNVIGSNDNDTLTVDFINGDAVPTGNVSFAGGGPTTGPGDRLVINGGTHALVTKNHVNSSDGNVVLDGNMISYTGLEPVDITGTTITSLVINLPDTDDATDDVTTFGISGGNLIVDSVNGEHEDDSIALAGITSLTINGRAGDDVITLLSTMSTFTGSVTIDGGNQVDDINLDSSLTLAGNSLLVTGETIDVGTVTISTTTGNQTFNGLLGLSGSTLTTGAGAVILGGNVTVGGTAVSAINGNLNLNGATRTFTVADAVAGAGIDG